LGLNSAESPGFSKMHSAYSSASGNNGSTFTTLLIGGLNFLPALVLLIVDHFLMGKRQVVLKCGLKICDSEAC